MPRNGLPERLISLLRRDLSSVIIPNHRPCFAPDSWCYVLSCLSNAYFNLGILYQYNHETTKPLLTLPKPRPSLSNPTRTNRIKSVHCYSAAFPGSAEMTSTRLAFTPRTVTGLRAAFPLPSIAYAPSYSAITVPGSILRYFPVLHSPSVISELPLNAI